ncbi:MAG: TMEM199/VMA12 family vacuolar ATPase assembly factor [Pseudomonadota bacterium]|nr:TMEM199/VMA12 family vacuolar ATPase assembly factor [Pseudomonadota bacterium]
MDFPARRMGEAKNARRANLRTALILLSIALVFFGGIIAAQSAGGTTIGIGVLGFGILGFLLVAVGRSVRK